VSTEIKIKRSGVAVAPTTLRSGELAYTWEGTTGGKLLIGWGPEDTPGEANNISAIGGLYYTNLLSSTAGSIADSKAVILDGNSKVNEWNVDNITIDGNTISTTSADTALNLSPNGTATVTVPASYKDRSGFGTNSLVTKEYVDGVAATIVSDFTISDGTDSDLFSTGQTLTFAGGTGLTSAITDNTVTFTLDDTAVTGGSYGSATQIPTFTVDGQGRLTAAGTQAISTTLDISAKDLAAGTGGDSSGTIALGVDTLSFQGDSAEGIQVTFNDVSKAVTINATSATTSKKGVASFNSANFDVTSGDVTIKDGGVANVELANSAVTVTAGSGLGGGGSVSLGSTISLNVNVDNSTLESDGSDTIRIKDGGVTNVKLANDSLTIGNTEIDLGATVATLAGLTQVDIDNVRIMDNSILTTDVNGDLTLSPNGQGVVKLPASYETRNNLDANSVVPKSYVDAIAEGLHIHASVKAATTQDLATESGGTVTYTNGTLDDGVGAKLTLATGISTLDGYTLVDGDRILIKDETAQEHNGIYVRTSSIVFTRATDFDVPEEIASGDFLFVENGTVNGSNGYVQTETHTSIGTGGDDIIFEQFSGAGQIDAGNGLTKSGNTLNAVGTADRISVAADAIDIAATYVGQNTITTLGTIATGVWNGTTVGVQHGGTGAATFTDNGVIYGNGTGALSVTAVSADSGSVLQTLTPGGVPVFSNIIDCGEY
jgi:hypothetical protein